MNTRHVTLCAIAVMALAGCAGMSWPWTGTSSERSLPTVSAPSTCDRIELKGILKSDPTDPRVAWLALEPTGRRQDVVWPDGYHAKFVQVGDRQVVEIFDGAGQQLVGDDDWIMAACDIGQPGLVLLEAPFG